MKPMQQTINGIQQVGIGVHCAATAFDWYKNVLGFSAIVFEDKAPASLMSRYTGGVVQQRYAVLAMNMQGGAGIEIWQYTSRKGPAPHQAVQLGHTGVYAIKIRSKNIEATYAHLQTAGVALHTPVTTHPAGPKHFFASDPFGNMLEVVEDDYWFTQKKVTTGGICGAVIGVNNLQLAIHFYTTTLGYALQWEGADRFADVASLPGGDNHLKRAVLVQQKPLQGPFGKLLGTSSIELVQVADAVQPKIYAGRWWGDPGFIHICFDVADMRAQQTIAEGAGHPFTVNSTNSFDMGTAAGHFAYNEDPDGTLIEYVETHQVPILKSINWHLNLRNRPRHKGLPDWMVKCMGLGQKKLQGI